MPAYKGHRNRKKPCGYLRVINKLSESYEVIKMDKLEADDALGIYATKYPGNVICSPDKDLRQIPGRLYNMDESFVVEEEEGDAGTSFRRLLETKQMVTQEHLVLVSRPQSNGLKSTVIHGKQ